MLEVLERQAEIEDAMQAANAAETATQTSSWLQTSSTQTQILALGSNMDKVKQLFNFKLENNSAFLPGAVSRKQSGASVD